MESATWEEESVFADSRRFLTELEAEIGRAEKSVEIEVYIFETGEMGDKLLEILSRKAERGIKVRLLVDGIGSMTWLNRMAGRIADLPVEVRVYHPVPWPFARFHWPNFYRLPKAVSLLGKANRRNHKKVFIIDQKVAFIGSPNVTDHTFTWHETGLRVKGDGVADLATSFEFCWSRSHRLLDMEEPKLSPAERAAPAWKMDLVRTNETVRRRAKMQKDIVRRMRASRRFIYVTTPYFVPPKRVFSALCWAASKGVEVKLLLAGPTDVRLLKWVTPFFYKRLVRSGVEIFEYRQKILHSKIVLIDDFALIGSSNLNHRSFFQDLEVDVVLTKEESRQTLIDRFHRDLDVSGRIGENQLASFNVFRWLVAKIVLFWKRSL